jgi:hypothetical protein
MTDPMPLLEGSLLLHIGPQKTGSTAIQMSMHENRPALAAQGVLYPGKEMRPREAGWAILGGGSAIGRPAPKLKRWTELLDEIAANTLPRVCVSNEDFGRADDAAVSRILEGLGTENTHLVFVARRLDKLLPSHYQERVKARMTLSYDEFLHHVLDTPDIDWEATVTWEPHDIDLTLGRWAKHLPADRMTVILSDEADRQLIPSTFEALLGLTPGTLKPPTVNSNTSLTYTQTEAVRRLNRLSREQDWTQQQYWRIIQAGVVKALRQAGGDDGPRITGLPAWAFPLVADRAEAQVAAIAASGAQVIGDPANLLLRGNVEPAELPASIETIPLDLLADLVAGAVDGAGSLHRREMRAAVRRAEKSGDDPEVSGRELLRMLGKRGAKRLRGM